MAEYQVLLLMNNCPAHTTGILDIANTEIKFLPPNTTLKLQPLDGRIIRTLKIHYHCPQLLTVGNIMDLLVHKLNAYQLIDYNGKQEICEVQMKKKFFVSLGSKNLVANDEEGRDDMVEHPYYISKQ
ncbi:4439_t:CDS:2, partial [Acaulospora morrowiae]